MSLAVIQNWMSGWAPQIGQLMLMGVGR